MIKYFNTLANERGDVLPNYRAQVVDSAGAIVAIYADKSGTRFTDASGNIINYATAASNGRVSFYWEPAVGQTLQTLDVAGDLVDAEADFGDPYVLGELPGTIAQSAVTGLTTDLAAKAATADLASTDAAKGAALVKLTDGATAQQAVAVAATPTALLATTGSLPVGATVRTANGFLYSVVSSGEHMTTAGGVKLQILPTLAGGGYDARAIGLAADGTTDDSAKVQVLLNLLSDGRRVAFPPGVIAIASTVTLSNTRAASIEGSGFPHVGLSKGTVFKWTGTAGGTIMHLDGVSQCTFRNFGFDGNSKSAGIGLLLDQGSTTVSQKLLFENVRWQACTVGTSIGVLGANQGNNDQTVWMNCWWQGNSYAFDLNGDQHVQHNFFNCQFLDCNDGSSTGAGIRTGGGSATVGSGSGSPNGGGFNLYGAAFLDNDIDMDIPRVNGPISIVGSRSENALVVMNHSSNSGTVGRTVAFFNFWQNSAAVGSTYSIDFDTANNLIVHGGRFVQPILIDNQVVGTAPTRSFIACEATVTRGSTVAYKYYNTGTDLNLNNKVRADGTTARFGYADQITIAAAGTQTIGAAASYTGIILVRRLASDRAAVFLCQNGAVSNISVDAAAWSSTAGNASTSNVYVTGGNLTIQNNTASTQGYFVSILGGAV